MTKYGILSALAAFILAVVSFQVGDRNRSRTRYSCFFTGCIKYGAISLQTNAGCFTTVPNGHMCYFKTEGSSLEALYTCTNYTKVVYLR